MSQEFPEAFHTEGPPTFLVGDDNYFYDLSVDAEWALSWDVPSLDVPPPSDD